MVPQKAALSVPDHRMRNNAGGGVLRIWLPLAFIFRTGTLLIKTSCRRQAREGLGEIHFATCWKHWWKVWWDYRNSLLYFLLLSKKPGFSSMRFIWWLENAHVLWLFQIKQFFKVLHASINTSPYFISDINFYFSIKIDDIAKNKQNLWNISQKNTF